MSPLLCGIECFKHCRGEFSGDYWTDTQRAKRPMFQEMHRMIDEYRGQFEEQKDPDCRIRRALGEYRDTLLTLRESLAVALVLISCCDSFTCAGGRSNLTDLDREVRDALMASNPKRLSGDRRRLEDFVFDYFGVREAGEAARLTTPPLKEKEANFEKRCI